MPNQDAANQAECDRQSDEDLEFVSNMRSPYCALHADAVAHGKRWNKVRAADATHPRR